MPNHLIHFYKLEGLNLSPFHYQYSKLLGIARRTKSIALFTEPWFHCRLQGLYTEHEARQAPEQVKGKKLPGHILQLIPIKIFLISLKLGCSINKIEREFHWYHVSLKKFVLTLITGPGEEQNAPLFLIGWIYVVGSGMTARFILGSKRPQGLFNVINF